MEWAGVSRKGAMWGLACDKEDEKGERWVGESEVGQGGTGRCGGWALRGVKGDGQGAGWRDRGGRWADYGRIWDVVLWMLLGS
jgi:hypothetical protein